MWDFKLLALILFVTISNFILGKKIFQTKKKKLKKNYLILSIFLNLIVLGFFKYFNFFIDNVNKVLGVEYSSLNIILPVGISFYTFQAMSYTIDIYRKKLKPEKSFLNFAFYISFFPQLVAGPIVRAIEFLPQIKRSKKILKQDYQEGVQIFIQGFVKKVVFANTLAIFTDVVFASPGQYDSYTIWLAVIAYTLQIYFDFSGYSDMAIGTARILGFNLVLNFNLPYSSTSVTQFWRRWHISLSRWIKDYIYISLGGNRKGKIRQYTNLIITMLLGGLWHGASWNFVIWGGLHGIALSIEKKLGLDKEILYLPFKIFSWMITMLFLMFTWVLFRAQTFEGAFIMLSKMVLYAPGASYIFIPLFYILGLTIIGHIFSYYLEKKQKEYMFFNLEKLHIQILFLLLIILIYIFTPTNSVPFIYLRF